MTRLASFLSLALTCLFSLAQAANHTGLIGTAIGAAPRSPSKRTGAASRAENGLVVDRPYKKLRLSTEDGELDSDFPLLEINSAESLRQADHAAGIFELPAFLGLGPEVQNCVPILNFPLVDHTIDFELDDANSYLASEPNIWVTDFTYAFEAGIASIPSPDEAQLRSSPPHQTTPDYKTGRMRRILATSTGAADYDVDFTDFDFSLGAQAGFSSGAPDLADFRDF